MAMISRSAWPPGVTVSVAPNVLAISIFSAERSTAMICFAPAMRQPWMTERPTPPHPTTAAVEPGRTAAVLMAAPTPVVIPHPTRAAAWKGRSFSMGTTQMPGTTACSAMLAEEGHHPHVLPVTVYPGGSVELVAVVGATEHR